MRFLRENADTTAHYEYTPTDELWALGVTFYWLLTDVYPFGERTDAGELAGLAERILTRRPVAPHLLNPRVPLAVSQVCMKMLAEWPAERYATVPELCSALQEALAQAENDSTWEVPLMDPHDPQVTTTLDDPELQEPNEVLRAFRKSGKKQPRRGLVRPKKALELLLARSPDEAPGAPARRRLKPQSQRWAPRVRLYPPQGTNRPERERMGSPLQAPPCRQRVSSSPRPWPPTALVPHGAWGSRRPL
ncbi:hypothetical protein BON30_48540 [Cystobacter ferrugineus]|uniref:Protein kinase domain-containing protein n=1 Tax=Cystobacter ferrugineus TaxID=83449 RepID=A0A1L9ATY4_9BACT|nr:hypothetical protein BON30_48540 [Cystobacter ferrugineus]